MVKGIVIAGTHSGCGKTTVTLGILYALKKKGIKVQPFKAGPDFIDTGLHTAVTGVPSRNLDLWMCGEEKVKQCFYTHASINDIAVIEGVMGMYDGQHSTAALANILQVPVILVVDAYGMAESAGAVVQGFVTYYEAPDFIGVVFNRVSSQAHFNMLQHCVRNVPVLGYLPYSLNFKIEERHLGLITAQENPLSRPGMKKLGEAVLKHINVDRILQGIDYNIQRQSVPRYKSDKTTFRPKVRIALAYDQAFCFYYADNLDLLREAGAKIIWFSPMKDKHLPDADVLYFGGGYPEVYAQALSENRSMIESVVEWANINKPIYAECGGMMYLSKGIHSFDNKFYSMADVMPFETAMDKARLHLGYREIVLKKDCIIGKKGDKLRGQEFHYSYIKDMPSGTSLKTCYKIKDQNKEEGYCMKNVLTSYIHIHFCSNLDVAKHFINFVRQVV